MDGWRDPTFIADFAEMLQRLEAAGTPREAAAREFALAWPDFGAELAALAIDHLEATELPAAAARIAALAKEFPNAHTYAN